MIGWTYDKGGNFILKLAPKTPNLELIARYLGMFLERKELRLGDLDKKSDAVLDAAIAQAAQEIAQAEGIPVEKVLAQLRAGGAGAGTTDALMSNPRVMLSSALRERAWRAKRNRLKYYGRTRNRGSSTHRTPHTASAFFLPVTSWAKRSRAPTRRPCT